MLCHALTRHKTAFTRSFLASTCTTCSLILRPQWTSSTSLRMPSLFRSRRFFYKGSHRCTIWRAKPTLATSLSFQPTLKAWPLASAIFWIICRLCSWSSESKARFSPRLLRLSNSQMDRIYSYTRSSCSKRIKASIAETVRRSFSPLVQHSTSTGTSGSLSRWKRCCSLTFKRSVEHLPGTLTSLYCLSMNFIWRIVVR